MSKMNYQRKQSSSFVPRTTGQSESERQESIMARMGKASYYALKGRVRRANLGDLDEKRCLTPDDMKQVREHRLRIKNKLERLAMIKEIAEANEIL